MSRAYRVNLNVLALVALFTGALLVFTTQALSVVRRRAYFALLRTLGMTRGALARWLVLEGALAGCAGAVLGIAGGYAIAYVVLRVVGADLGAGYFRGVAPRVVVDPVAACVFAAAGVAVAALGSLAPAREAARAQPAAALKSVTSRRHSHACARRGPALRCWPPGLQ
jgi:putative ABC transport system permease protein